MHKIVNRNRSRGKIKTLSVIMLFAAACGAGCVHKSVTEKANDALREPASSSQPPHLRFEECSAPSKLYLEDKIAMLPPEYYQQSHENEWSQKIPMRCMQIAQKNFSGHFASCANSNAKPTTNARKPCMTENYTTLTYNAYHDVMDCFNLNPKDFFLQIMIESGFHVNAINKTGFDSGMSQFTANGIKRVTANNLVERTRRILLESSRSSCQRVSSIIGAFGVDSFQPKNRCSVISLPENPYRAMFFNYLHTMLDEISLDEMVEQIPEIKAVMNERIKRHLVYLAYNRGLTGVKRLLVGYVESRKNVNHEIVSEDLDLNQDLTSVKRILHFSPDKREKLRNAKKIINLSFAEYAVIQGATYISDMAAANEYAQKFFGDECGGL